MGIDLSLCGLLCFVKISLRSRFLPEGMALHIISPTSPSAGNVTAPFDVFPVLPKSASNTITVANKTNTEELPNP